MDAALEKPNKRIWIRIQGSRLPAKRLMVMVSFWKVVYMLACIQLHSHNGGSPCSLCYLKKFPPTYQMCIGVSPINC
ncbi:hypothetical protein Pcinc_013722 [Petrolisthes cinctipes]|uniref:Uncharacterized protein n=1 Tax=Petrolisthes cinctipes TaxID=88211 RepID=A0AAE1FYD3_PETCI|nr:hypothetical protein Pcinc_013722 [Petrolisthes cinctipes]